MIVCLYYSNETQVSLYNCSIFIHVIIQPRVCSHVYAARINVTRFVL